MDKTPKATHSRYLNYPIKSADSGGSPVQLHCSSRNDLSFDCSPILSQCTSDNYDVDVIWDWNSPRTKTNVKRGKRQHPTEQEKLPLKKTSSGNPLPTFDRLKKTLEELKEEITEKKSEKPVNSTCVDFEPSHYHNHFMGNIPELEELFNDDSFEDQLVLCSQNVENHFIVPSQDMKIESNDCEKNNFSNVSNKTKKIDIKINGTVQKDTRIINNNNADILKPKKFNFKPSNKVQTGSLQDIFGVAEAKPTTSENKVNKPMEDDSFDSVLAVFDNDDMELLNEINNQQSKKVEHCNKSKCLENGIKPLPRSPQFRKTSSFDDTFLKPKFSSQCKSLSKETLEEIERKRKKALAKLEAKRKAPSLIDKNSPIECSPEKIEQLKTVQVHFRERSKCLETGIKPLPKSPQFRKTTSFDDSFLKDGSSRQECLSKETLEEIERKRKEALAKLGAKKKTTLFPPVDEISPIKCSPEEIEQKRLQALAKREAKRKQEIIEHNRLEALKRLEMNKKKQAFVLQNAHRTAPKTLPYNIAENNR